MPEKERDLPDGNPESESPVPSSLSLSAWVSLQSQGPKLRQNSTFACYWPPRQGVAMELAFNSSEPTAAWINEDCLLRFLAQFLGAVTK